MLTEEELGAAIGSRLRAETADLQPSHDMAGAVRRRRARRAVATRTGLAVGVAAVAAAAGVAVAVAPGAPASRQQAAAHQAAGPTIRLDGYQITMPEGTHVRKLGVGYLVGDQQAGQFVIFLMRGPVAARMPKLMAAHGARPVKVGRLTGWWAGARKAGRGTGGELLLHAPGLAKQEFLVAKAFGASEAQVLAFAARLNLAKMGVVHVTCVHNCG